MDCRHLPGTGKSRPCDLRVDVRAGRPGDGAKVASAGQYSGLLHAALFRGREVRCPGPRASQCVDHCAAEDADFHLTGATLRTISPHAAAPTSSSTDTDTNARKNFPVFCTMY